MGLLSSAGAVAALHLLRPDLEPAGHRLSEYAVGPWGWLMTTAFVAFAGGVWAVRATLAAACAGLCAMRALLGLAAAGMLVAAVFETDTAAPAAVRERIHSVASSSALLCLVVAALAASTIARGAAVSRGRRVLADAAATVAVLGAVVSPAAHDGPWTGAVQRLSYGAIVAWLLLVARAGPAPVNAADRRAGTRPDPGPGR